MLFEGLCLNLLLLSGNALSPLKGDWSSRRFLLFFRSIIDSYSIVDLFFLRLLFFLGLFLIFFLYFDLFFNLLILLSNTVLTVYSLFLILHYFDRIMSLPSSRNINRYPNRTDFLTLRLLLIHFRYDSS